MKVEFDLNFWDQKYKSAFFVNCFWVSLQIHILYVILLSCMVVLNNLQLYPPKDWLVGSSLPSKFSPNIIQKVLDDLSPNNVR